MKLVHDELLAAGADVFYLDHHDIFNCEIEYSYSAERGETCVLRNNDRTLDLKAVKAAYLRPYDFRDYKQVADKPSDDPVMLKAAGFEMHLIAYFDASDAMVVNRSKPSATNNSKPFQLSLIKQAGFKIPETLITNDAEQAREFLDRHHDVVFKSISGQRSIVEQVAATHREFLEDVKWCSTLFQKVVPGNNYRVHVLKDEIFAVRIESDKLDYRYGNTTMVAEQLPSDIAERCRKLAADLGLLFAGIDLMRSPDDEWYCFEVNPSPGYSCFQENSGLAISTALARMLTAA
ncbi:MAG TPA: ATP-grasp domain-containing protein [Gallionella sp.]|nr:ATP-grasp domain-containing protein [Gallionella sp.]